MSAIAELAYKTHYGSNKDWFAGAHKKRTPRISFGELGGSKKENAWVSLSEHSGQLISRCLVSRETMADHCLMIDAIDSSYDIQQRVEGLDFFEQVPRQLLERRRSGKTSRVINHNNCAKTEVIKTKPVSQQEVIGLKFVELASEWKNAVQIISDWNLMVLHPSYQRIIGLGPDVIPFILKELEQSGGHWFWALQALTGENPVADEDAGRTRKMTEAWLAWGKGKGYI